MKEIKELTEEMLHKELVETLNYNFKKLDEDAKATRKYMGDKFDDISSKFKNVNTDIYTLQKDMTEVKESLNLIIAYLKSDNDKTLLTDNKK